MDNENMYNEEMPQVEKQKPMGVFTSITALFFSPIKLMENLKKNPRLGAPFLFFLVAGLVMGFLAVPYSEITMVGQQQIILERYGREYYDFMQSAMSMSQQMGGGAGAAITTISGALGGVVGIATMAFIVATLYFLVAKIAKSSITYKQTCSAFLYIFMIQAIGNALSILMSVLLYTPLNVFTLAMLMPDGNLLNPTFNILSAIGIFPIWMSILIFIALMKVGELSKTKAGVIAVLGYVIMVVYEAVVTPMIALQSLDFSYNLISNMGR